MSLFQQPVRELAKHKEAQIVERHLMEIAFRYGSAYRAKHAVSWATSRQECDSEQGVSEGESKILLVKYFGLVDISSQQLGSMK